MPPSHPTTVDDFISAARSAATKRAYANDFADFTAWCREGGEAALPASPITVGRYLADRAHRLKPSTLNRRLAAIVVIHRQAGCPLDARAPAIADVMAGIRRTIGTAPTQKDALSLEDIRLMVEAQPNTLTGIRDGAIILLGFAGAFRRSELAALTTKDLAWSSDGVVVTVRRSKEAQEANGSVRAIPFGIVATTCPVRALRRWIMAAQLDGGPVFRRIDCFGNRFADGLSGDAIAQVVKKAIRLVGHQQGWTKAEITARVAAVAGHSLRAGFVTSAARAGAAEWNIMQHTGHRQISSVRRYIRRGDIFDTSPVSGIGL